MYKQNIGNQLVLPKDLRNKVLELGHSVPMARHMRRQKTLARIAHPFYWPDLYSDVVKYCQSCPECQYTANVRQSECNQLLDIVGPLEKRTSGNIFIIAFSEYATCYPGAFPLRSIRARPVAKALGLLITRVGIPSEIITDQGLNFMSSFIQQM